MRPAYLDAYVASQARAREQLAHLDNDIARRTLDLEDTWVVVTALLGAIVVVLILLAEHAA